MPTLINCKDCGKQVSKNAKTCPSCGAPVPKTSIVMIVAASLVSLFVVCGVVSVMSTSGTATTTALKTVSKAASSNLELLEGYKAIRGEYGNVTIVGKVKNNGSHEYSYAQITFNLYDKNGSQVGSALANVNNLEAGGVWKFSAACIDGNFDSFKFKEITGF
jgi:archaellum component FlaG (FlaF/FlaG flagellin family)